MWRKIKFVAWKLLWNSFIRKPFSIKWIYLIEKRWFEQKYKFSSKNDMVCTWRNFKNIFSRPLFTIIFRPKLLFFVTYSIDLGRPKLSLSYIVSSFVHCSYWKIALFLYFLLLYIFLIPVQNFLFDFNFFFHWIFILLLYF